MDKSKLVRLLLISVSLLVYFHFFKPRLEVLPAAPIAQEAIVPNKANPLVPAPFGPLYNGDEENITVENDLLKVILSTKGGTIKSVVLKKYKDKNGQEAVLLDEKTSHMGFAFHYKDLLIETKDLYFTTEAKPYYKLTENEVTAIVFRLELSPSQYLEQIFEFSGNSYKINYAWNTLNMEKYLGKTCQVHFLWNMDMKSMESDVTTDISKSTINYYLNNGVFDNLKETSTKLEKASLALPIKWVSIKQRFFSSAIIAGDVFTAGDISLEPTLAKEDTTKSARLSLELCKNDKEEGHGMFAFFFGPNDYATLLKVTKGFQRNLPLGWTIVRIVNQGLILPLFSFLEKYLSNYGLIIFLLVVVTKLILAPLSYKSFISMAKMKFIKPELDKIKEKHGNDLQKAQAEQMLLYRELDINPLSGCIPILLQMPILLAMFNFFPNAVALRQVSFLWAHDLSTYDNIINLPFTIPVYGNHVSLFTLLMVLSTILYTWSSNQNGSTKGPMKGLAYIMPISFMFVLNSFPAGLSFYYCVSNIISFLQQILTKYFVNEKDIKAKLVAKQKRGRQGSASSFQARIKAAIQTNNKKRNNQLQK